MLERIIQRMIDETNHAEPPLFSIIYNAAIAQDQAQLDQIKLTETLNISNLAGIYVVTQLAQDSKKDAVNFLIENNAGLYLAIRGYGHANNFKAFTKILAAQEHLEDKLELLTSLIRGLAFANHLGELKSFALSISMQTDSSKKYKAMQEGKAIGFANSNNVDAVDEMLADASEEEKLLIEPLIIQGLGTCGNLDKIKEVIANASGKDVTNKMELYYEAIYGLIRGNHLGKLQDIVRDIPVKEHQALLSKIAAAMATYHQTHNIKILLESTEGANHTFVFKAALENFIGNETLRPAHNLLLLAKNNEERLMVFKSVIPEYRKHKLHAKNLSELAESTRNAEEEVVVLTETIDSLLKTKSVAEVEALSIDPKYNAHLSLVLTKLIYYYAKKTDAKKVTATLKRCKTQKNQSELAESMFSGYIVAEKDNEITNYLKTLKNDKKIDGIKQAVNAYCKLYPVNTTVSYEKHHLSKMDALIELGSDEKEITTIGKYILKKYIELQLATHTNDFIANQANKVLQKEFLQYVSFEYGKENYTLVAKKLLSNVNNTELQKEFLASLISGLVHGNHAREAIKFQQTLTQPADKATILSLLIKLLSKPNKIAFLSEILSTIDDLNELNNLIEKSIDRKSLYSGAGFKTVDAAVQSLALINDETIRRSIAIQLANEKKDNAFDFNLLLPKAAKQNKLINNVVLHFSNPELFFKPKSKTNLLNTEPTLDVVSSLTNSLT